MEETTTNNTPSSPEVALGVACCAGAFDPPAATSVDTTAGALLYFSCDFPFLTIVHLMKNGKCVFIYSFLLDYN